MWLFFFCREIFFNPKTNDTWNEGDYYKRETLAKTLEKIALNGADEFYTGETGMNFVHDIQKAGGIISMDDLKNYT